MSEVGNINLLNKTYGNLSNYCFPNIDTCREQAKVKTNFIYVIFLSKYFIFSEFVLCLYFIEILFIKLFGE